MVVDDSDDLREWVEVIIDMNFKTIRLIDKETNPASNIISGVSIGALMDFLSRKWHEISETGQHYYNYMPFPLSRDLMDLRSSLINGWRFEDGNSLSLIVGGLVNQGADGNLLFLNKNIGLIDDMKYGILKERKKDIYGQLRVQLNNIRHMDYTGGRHMFEGQYRLLNELRVIQRVLNGDKLF